MERPIEPDLPQVGAIALPLDRPSAIPKNGPLADIAHEYLPHLVGGFGTIHVARALASKERDQRSEVGQPVGTEDESLGLQYGRVLVHIALPKENGARRRR